MDAHGDNRTGRGEGGGEGERGERCDVSSVEVVDADAVASTGNKPEEWLTPGHALSDAAAAPV